jgi:AraC-like DNA-binding protein
MNTNFYDYINQARVEAAKRALAASDASVLAIALEIGYNSRSAFYNAFKKHSGQTPSAYRAELKNS